MQKRFLAVTIIVMLTALFAWSPWLTPERASSLAETQFNKAWAGVVDGCGTNGNDLGAKHYQKIPFGAYVTLDYQCGLVMPGDPVLHTNIYVSFFGIAFRYPKP